MMTAIEAGLISVLGDGRGAGLARALAPIDRHMTAARGRAHGQSGFLLPKN